MGAIVVVGIDFNPHSPCGSDAEVAAARNGDNKFSPLPHAGVTGPQGMHA